MMAAVFLMQPLGQLLASVVGLAVLLTVGRNAGLATETDPESAKVIVDRIWRYVVGVGAIPALVAIGFRLTIPESPRFTLDVDHDGARALRDTQKYFNIRRASMNGSTNGNLQVYTDDVEDDAGMQQVRTLVFLSFHSRFCILSSIHLFKSFEQSFLPELFL
jgi:MFS family permease